MYRITPKVKGDSFDLTFNLIMNDGSIPDLLNYKIRCEIYDSSHHIRLASDNSGGSDDEIKVVNLGKFRIYFAKDLTADFDDVSNIEVEVETTDSPSKKFTILQEEIRFKNQRINWELPND